MSNEVVNWGRMATPEEIFAEINTRITGDADRIKDEVDGTFKFILTGDGGGNWIVNCKDDVGVTASDDGAECEMTMEAEVFAQIYDGSMDGMQAFMMGQITLSDDSGTVVDTDVNDVMVSCEDGGKVNVYLPVVQR